MLLPPPHLELQLRGEEPLRQPARGLDHVPADLGPLLVDEVVALGEEVAHERALGDRQALVHALAGPGLEQAEQQDPLPGTCLGEVVQQAAVVQVASDPTAQPAGLADVQRLAPAAPAPGEDVDAGPAGDEVEVDLVLQSPRAHAADGDRAGPVEVEVQAQVVRATQRPLRHGL